MPTYEYRCPSCGQRFERFQSMSEQPLRSCPRCGGPVSRIIGAGAAVIIKGSGGSAGGGRNAGPPCGSERPCCGRSAPCERRPCDQGA